MMNATGRLTHEQAVALLEVVAHLVDTAADTPQTPPGPSRMTALVAAMQSVGVDPAVIHAYEQTGILVGDGDEDLWSPDELRRWQAAVSAYDGNPAPARA
jgi:hypothetical protein